MARNVKQVYDANPSTTLGANSLLYAGNSPYGLTDDTAILYSNLFTQIQSTIGTGNILMSNGNAIRTGTSIGNNFSLSGWDTNDNTYRTVLVVSANNIPSLQIGGSGITVSIDGANLGGNSPITISQASSITTNTLTVQDTTTLNCPVTMTEDALIQKYFTANSGAAITINPANGAKQIITLDDATPVITLPAALAAGKYQTLELTLLQDGVGGRIPSFVNATYAAGVAPTIAQGAGDYTYLSLSCSPLGTVVFAAAQVLPPTATLYDPGYLYGFQLEGLTDTTFTIKAGYCIDSTNVTNIVLGDTTVNMAVNGANGLDTGSFAASSNYCVYVIADSSGVNSPAGIASLGTAGPTTMPAGYDKFRFIGYIFSDSSVHIYDFTCKGKGNVKEYYIDSALDSAILTGGASATQTSIGTLSDFIPNTGFVSKIKFQAEFVPGLATDYARITPAGFSIAGNGAPVVLGSGVNTVHFLSPFEMEPGETSYQIDYLVDSAASALTLVITGFSLSL